MLQPRMSAARDAWMDGWMDGWMAGWRDGGMAGWRDGGMEGWRDGRMEGYGADARPSKFRMSITDQMLSSQMNSI